MFMRAIPFMLVHLMPLGAIWAGVRTRDVVLCFALYAVRMFFITGGFHRYFAHRSYKANRVVQFLMAFGAQTAAQRGVLWWAAHHRHHHRFSDMPEDSHSPLRGFLWSHVTWFFHSENRRTKSELIKDFYKYPELRFLNKFHLLPAIMLGAVVFFTMGASALFTGFFLSTVLLYHGTFFINSLAHVMGTRRFVTHDTSRNNFGLALITGGEGWHNNHHHYPSAASQGFYWWEIDTTYYTLRLMNMLGLISDLRQPTEEALSKNLVRDGHADIGMFQAHWSKAASALVNTRTQTGAFYEARKREVEARRKTMEEFVVTTKTRADEVARSSRDQIERARMAATTSQEANISM